ncbi:MAG: hypothetical protein QOH14_2528 [Pseudonocardiales bacterium]|nr:hypothetical protein [Pseudonocardiales bacterium]
MKAGVAVGLLIAGLVCAALFRIVSGTEHHAYSSGAVPPASSGVTAGNTYHLSVPGGVQALQKRGASVAAAQCTWSTGGSANQVLTATPEGAGTKATNVVASFIAPYTGDIHVDCAGWGAMYIDDADNSPADSSGWFLVLAVVTLTLGVGMALSSLRSAAGRASSSADGSPGEDDEVERFVHAVHVRSQDGEVGAADGDDVLA